jgi:hypothetical protein
MLMKVLWKGAPLENNHFEFSKGGQRRYGDGTIPEHDFSFLQRAGTFL